jgi:deoxycytidine triphosphate deaminase
MVLGIDKLLQLVKEKKLVENLSERELNNPEGAGFDFRIGEVYEIAGEGFLGVEERQTPEAKLVAKYNPEEKTIFEFQPNKFYLFKTIEKVNLPEDLALIFRPRSTTFRSGLVILTGNVQPGYSGELTMGIYNTSSCNVKIELGARVVHGLFLKVEGKSNPYRGQWQGGRVDAKEKEEQI